MPQLSLYIDEETLRRVEIAARLESVSISKYVVRKLNETLSSLWPQGYETFFGSIRDESYRLSEPPDFAADSTRETL